MTARAIRIVGDLAFVELNRGLEAVIDAADVPLVSGFTWYAHKNRNVVYVVRADRSGPKQRTVSMHRTIAGEPAGLDVDHIDGDGLNNRRSNLRLATKSQNTQNQRINRRNTSGFKGVSFHKSSGTWRAAIRMNRKRKHLGCFRTPEAAHAAYSAASAEYHGQFGRADVRLAAAPQPDGDTP